MICKLLNGKFQAVDMSFQLMQNGNKVDVFEYINHYLALHPGVEVHIGCDSQNYQSHTLYVMAVVFRHPGDGAHVLYRKEKVRKIDDLWTKLWGEIERSVNLANDIYATCNIKVAQIDLDYNSDPSFPSNKLLSAATGYAQSLGFIAKAKPELLMAAWAANVLCH